MADKQLFKSVVATNGLQQPYRRKTQTNLKRLFALIVMAIGVVTIGSSFS